MSPSGEVMEGLARAAPRPPPAPPAQNRRRNRGIVVRAVSQTELGPLVDRLPPADTSPWSLPVVAVVAALLATTMALWPTLRDYHDSRYRRHDA
jgi:hypothetical protein